VTPEPRILVTDAEERSALAACRGLAVAGYRVTTVSDERLAVGHWSRRSKERITLVRPHGDPDGYIERLAEVLRRSEYHVVMPTTEASLVPISERRALIEPYARLGLPSHEIVLRALDKQVLQRQASDAGLAPPPSVACSSQAGVVAAARELRFPLVVKAARSFTRTDGRLQHQRARVVEGASALEAAVAACGLPVTIQEYVPRATIVSCAAVRIDGRLLGLTLVRYARTFPAHVGSAALAVTIAPPGPLVEQIEELLRLIGWSGIFELELLELGEKRFGAIDFNPRPFGWMALAIAAGANLPALWCDHLLGRRSVAPNVAQPGISYRWEEGDVRNALAQLRRGRLRGAAAVVRPYRRVVHALFRLDDPAPLVAWMLSSVQKAARRAIPAHAHPRAAPRVERRHSA
jgi:predicted ATP-grasp superfamily ATP-dependent carboligase